MMRLNLAATLVLICIPIRAFSDDWPQWRGASGNGVSSETNLPTRWSKEDVAWKAPLRGLGVSSPIVWGDRVFVTSQIGSSALRPGMHPTLVQGADAATSGERPLGGARSPAADEKIAFVV